MIVVLMVVAASAGTATAFIVVAVSTTRRKDRQCRIAKNNTRPTYKHYPKYALRYQAGRP
jgi:hypothetical protein